MAFSLPGPSSMRTGTLPMPAGPAPGFSPSPSGNMRTLHSYDLRNKDDHPWVTLTMRKSRAPNAAQLPFYIQGDRIEGVVELDLENEVYMVAIEICILGTATFAMADHVIFLDEKQLLWESEMDDSSSSCSGSRGERLKGRYEFPFTVELPREVKVKANGLLPRTYELPPSFSDRDSSAHVQYQITIKLKKVLWHWFRMSSKVGTSFGYIPMKRPGAPSYLRQRSYRDNSPLIGLLGDPDGWHTLPSFTARGTMFNSRHVEIVYTLSLANPLCYTRGTTIPCIMTISTPDLQALDLLSCPKSQIVRLVRRISQSLISKPKQEEEVKVVSVGAAWWPSLRPEDRRANKKTLFGELRLEKNLKPSCIIGYFQLSYHVTLFTSKATAFSSYDDASRPLMSQEVEIMAGYPQGPRPRVYSPPGSETEPLPLESATGCHWKSMNTTFVQQHGLG